MLFALFLSLALLHTARSALPPGWKACKRSASDYNQCLTQQVENAIVSLKSGNKKLPVSPIDPLLFKSVMIDQATGPVAIKLEFRDFSYRGLGSTKITSIKNDWKTMDMKIFVKEVKTSGDYKINGKVLVLPIVGDGKCSIDWYNMTADVKLNFKEVENKGKKFFQVSQFLIDIKPQKVHFQFDNLFNGDKALGDNMNIFLNENWAEIINEIKPAITKALNAGFSQVCNQVFSKIPKNEIDIN